MISMVSDVPYRSNAPAVPYAPGRYVQWKLKMFSNASLRKLPRNGCVFTRDEHSPLKILDWRHRLLFPGRSQTEVERLVLFERLPQKFRAGGTPRRS
ncbi:hypothetical protein D9758_014597 [Tetrapyrgos nigripes]|uniref:Uncharacterized protein n=1 Tax=Tetrapyrgos nigripes TaxID=182062 RepID=A0A8H5FCZ1_9AGAR|nr:hypothetical protein D9758_014597 [Tetrapyrgos nigripes]